MSELYNKLIETCQKLGFKIKEADDDNIIICFQMHIIHICFNEKAANDCTVLTVVLTEVSDEDRPQVLERCNTLNERLKLFKYYISKANVLASIEFRFNDDDELAFQLEYAVRSLSQARTIYKRDD